MSLFSVEPVSNERFISLTAYITSKLEPAADLIQNRNYNGALALLEEDKLDLKEPFQEIERRYLKGLCWQALSDFEKAMNEFDWVIQNTKRSELQANAKIGREAAAEKCKSLNPEQLQFPAYEFAVDVRMERRRREIDEK